MNIKPENNTAGLRRSRVGVLSLVATLSTMTSLTLGINAMADNETTPAADLIVNGGFEEPVVRNGGYVLFSPGQQFPGWQVIGAQGNVAPISGQYLDSGIRFPAREGNQWLDMTGGSNSATAVQQTVRTQPGTIYHLAFSVGNIYQPGGSFGTTSSVEVLVDGPSAGSCCGARCFSGWLRLRSWSAC
jgi:hypothetical protein